MKNIKIIALIFFVCSVYGQEYSFPDDFKFGVATASYQIEGAWNVSGKGESNWDRFTHENPNLIADGSNGDIACDSYNHVKEDVQLVKNLGVNFYRFSISWARILPNGKADEINPDGIRYYNELIDELLANDIQPMVTILHIDLPQALEDEGGFLNETLIDHFEAYADILFENFGDRVKDWITFNEPIMTCNLGYSSGALAPGVQLEGIGGYICGRILLIAHARAYHLYNNRYKAIQQGRIGITLNSNWFEPLSDSAEDAAATELALQLNVGWFAHPIFSEDGDYPSIMKERIAKLSEEEGFSTSRLPEFTQEEIELIRGSSDFFGFNHYTTTLCTVLPEDEGTRPSFDYDAGIVCTTDPDWETGASWIKVVPWGFKKIIVWIKETYNNPEVIITENGYSHNDVLIDDCRRINYYNLYLTALLEAIFEDDCNVTGYAAWSLMDNFEWTSGYTIRFGLYSVDFEDPNRTRTAKMSTYVYRNIISTRKIDWSYSPEDFEECIW